jgi:hypothetical protein
MLVRFPGAVLRGMMVAALVAAPCLLLPAATGDLIDVVVFLALVAGVFTSVEYIASAPSILEFRDAPPFNRLRFITLLAIFATLATLQHDGSQVSTLSQLVAALASRASELVDFPGSPVRMAMVMLPPDASAELAADVRIAAGVSSILSVAMLVIFWGCIRFGNWPAREGGFNIWINMPTFDPMAGGDIVPRLRRDAFVNVVLAILLPLLIPPAVQYAAGSGRGFSLSDPHLLIWTMTAWAFLPAMRLMRGMAILRVARMIEAQRARAAVPDKALQPA